MFISKLKHIIDKHDIYGIHRLNGLKVVYVYILLAIVNMIYNIPHPYFYFFYLPLTAIIADITTTTIRKKYIFYILTVLGTCIAIIIFNFFKSYPLYFYLAVFITSVLLYYFVLNKQNNLLPFVPILLSLASYSLLYPSINQNIRMMLFNVAITFLAMLIIISGSLLFPLSYYYRAWLRAFHLNCKDILALLQKIAEENEIEFSIRQEHLRSMVTFAQMLPNKFPTFTILKINLLLQELYFNCVYRITVDATNIINLQKNMQILINAIEKEESCTTTGCSEPTFNKITRAWNRLCHI